VHDDTSVFVDMISWVRSLVDGISIPI